MCFLFSSIVVIAQGVSEIDIASFKAKDYIRYSDFGAKGDGTTNDSDAIAATHNLANQQNLPVKADGDATYYIGGKNRTATIRTDTDFGSAAFIIDDRKVEDRTAFVFLVDSELKPFKPQGITTL